MNEFFSRLAVIALLDLLAAWALTMLLDILHEEWWQGVPTMDYWTAIWVVVLVGIVVAPWRGIDGKGNRS
ncbi:hypothetical protein HS041_22560 [Planomonospora sp. ID67723]|uniref:hypothetical protein n=1 Tax=Planomonospora sp. ID67723 TaxID=2738134 RepID=UPI0018C436AE|nr:hypothetical protein [Planomonospora sp. ID67723]MBG0830548.1 hypothetical protein [Planomonospora sp. ID67723]